MYNPQEIETKWLNLWEDWKLFQQTERADVDLEAKKSGTSATDTRDKIYLLFAFAYPSGSGLHVGHAESKTALDILARYHRMHGKDVFFPVGWDAFGLPAENYAIKTGVPPAETTKNAINTFRRQIKRLAISYDWANEIATCHPGYYKWTQWLFLQLYAKDLAYKKTGLVNWCPSCQTVLANEQVVDGECERCGSQVIQKEMDQWFFRITEYQDELISGLDEVDWPEATKQQQMHWIGKSEGAVVRFKVADSDSELEVFTTAHDTIYGCTFMVVAPEHKLLDTLKDRIQNWDEVQAYITETQKKTELQRQINKEKTGLKVEGVHLVHPLTHQEIPLFIADYVLASYGTGAIMAVPGHDERDMEFAQQFDLPIIYTYQAKEEQTDTEPTFVSYTDIKAAKDTFTCINSQEFDGMNVTEARDGILQKLESAGAGQEKKQYKLRDWLISRQRYWGAPIPMVYDPEGNLHPVHEDALPWELPTDVDYNPKGVSPLASSQEFLARTERYAAQYHADLIAQKGWDTSGKGWHPEYDTMDTFVDSSWYFLRYLDARNEFEFASKSQLDRWLPVDFYMIGPEHIVLHLLYSRFFTKFLRDQGYLDINEPFAKMRHQGMILGPDHRKMSKSKGNVINPDDVIEKFGADTLRVYEMFMGPIEADKPWDTRAVVGVYKFLQRVHELVSSSLEMNEDAANYNETVRRKIHQTIEKVSTDIPQLKFNTAIASMMECLNLWEKEQKSAQSLIVAKEDIVAWIKIIAPFAPFLAEELYAITQPEVEKGTTVHISAWPEHDPALSRENSVTIPVQINGKVRAQLEVDATSLTDAAQVITQAKELEAVQSWLADSEIVKEIYVPGKIINFAVK